MKSRLIITEDGSHTLLNPDYNEHYHSTFGAIQESNHIFIEAALNKKINLDHIKIFEVGTGTGLNVLLSLLSTINKACSIYYEGIELFPITNEESELLNYSEKLNCDKELISRIHSNYNQVINIRDDFKFLNRIEDIREASIRNNFFDIVYFDAFSPESQPELWSDRIFKKIYDGMSHDGILTTYSCKGIVKRAIRKAGFELEKLPGPPGKREFLRATKR